MYPSQQYLLNTVLDHPASAESLDDSSYLSGSQARPSEEPHNKAYRAEL